MAEKGKISEGEGRRLLEAARKTLEESLLNREASAADETDLPKTLGEKRGVFVTLTVGENLRGCIGHITPQEPLIEGAKANALNAAFNDPRFPPLRREELERVRIEVSVLTRPEPVAYDGADDLLRQLRPNVDGVIIKKGYHQATFLPQVWEQLPRKEAFLNHLCLKAGLEENAWRRGDLEVSTYQVQAFEE